MRSPLKSRRRGDAVPARTPDPGRSRAANSASFIEATGLADIAARYSALFVDAYGVLHDGAAAFPGAPETLRQARRAGLKVVIVTNAASRVAAVGVRLEEAGISRDCYDAITSSGELSWQYLDAGAVDRAAPLYLITEAGGPAWVSSLANPLVEDIRKAEIVVAAGMPFITETSFYDSDFAETLQRGAARRLPMIVADSDETYPSHGVIRLGPGWLARLYAAMGGPLVEFGKPHRPIYEAASRLADHPPREKILAIGDNLLTDVAGAVAFGIDSMLVLEGGVHAAQPRDRLRKSFDVAPTYVAPRLAWRAGSGA